MKPLWCVLSFILLFLQDFVVNNDVRWVVQEYSRRQNNHIQVPVTEQVLIFLFEVFVNESFGDSTNRSVYLQTTHLQPPLYSIFDK